MKIAVIGTGIIGDSHLRAIRNSASCTLCAVCDINETVASAKAEEYGVPYFTDYRDIPDKTGADAVILNLPHWLHCEATEFFLKHDLHVLVEKPMANTVAECDKMIETAQRTGKKLAVGHLQRFFDANRKVKEICQSGELGRLCMVTEYRTIDYFIPSRPKWFLDKNLAGGGIVMNYGAHALDKLFYVMDSRPVEISAAVGNVKNDCSVEGHAQIFVRFDNNVSANITFSGYFGSGYECVYYFTHGALKVVNGTQLWKRSAGDWEAVQTANIGNHMSLQLEEFCKLVRDEPSEMPTMEYARDVIATIEKIYGTH